MHVEVDRLVDAQQRDALVAGIERVLGDVRAAVEDWKPMLARLHEAIAELDAAPASLPAAPVAESRAFLQWLADDHFTLLGYRRHDLVQEQRRDRLRLVPGSGLGVLRETAEEKPSASFAALPPQARAPWRAPPCRCWWSPRPTRARRCTGPATPTMSASSATTPAAR